MTGSAMDSEEADEALPRQDTRHSPTSARIRDALFPAAPDWWSETGHFKKHFLWLNFNQEAEDAFARSRQEILCRQFSRVALAACVVFASDVIANMMRLGYDEDFTMPTVVQAYLAHESILGITGMAIALNLRRCRDREGIPMRMLEVCAVMAMVWLFAHCIMMWVIHPKYSAELREFLNMKSLRTSKVVYTNDNYFRVTSLAMCAMLAVYHGTMSIRWRTMVIADAFYLISLSVCTYIVGNADIFILMAVIGMTSVSSLGHRSSEFNARLYFAAMAGERTKRAEAEFSARSQTSGAEESHHRANRGTPSHKPESEFSAHTAVTRDSAATTTVTNNLFQQADVTGLMKLGIQEQWLIKEDELVIWNKMVLGQGAYGVVVAGRFCKSPVAIKRLVLESSSQDPTTASDEGQDAARTSSVWNELRILRHVRHPHIALFHGAAVESRHQGGIMLVLERVPGATLNEYITDLDIASKPPCFHAAKQLTILYGICQALIYLHSRRPIIVHGDLKPSNILVEQRGAGPYPKLLDFGLSRTVTRSAKLEGGSPRYIAPEVIVQFRNYRPSPAADVFAVGRLIYFVCCGRQPLAGLQVPKVLEMCRNGKVPPLVWTPSDELLRSVRKLVEQCTLYTAEARPTSADVHDKLEFLDMSATWSLGVPQDVSNGQPEAPTGSPGRGPPEAQGPDENAGEGKILL